VVGASYFFESFFKIGLLVESEPTPFDSLDFNLAALLGWIKCTLAALSKAEKAAVKSLADLLILAFLTKDFKVVSRFLLRAVLSLSLRTFFIADLMIGMGGMVT